MNDQIITAGRYVIALYLNGQMMTAGRYEITCLPEWPDDDSSKI